MTCPYKLEAERNWADAWKNEVLALREQISILEKKLSVAMSITTPATIEHLMKTGGKLPMPEIRVGRRKATNMNETQSPHPVGSSAWLEPLRDQLRVQGEHGNWNCNDYMLGMFNGLECALATLEHREPQYRRKPDDGWLDDRTPPGFVPTVCDGSNAPGERPLADSDAHRSR